MRFRGVNIYQALRTVLERLEPEFQPLSLLPKQHELQHPLQLLQPPWAPRDWPAARPESVQASGPRASGSPCPTPPACKTAGAPGAWQWGWRGGRVHRGLQSEETVQCLTWPPTWRGGWRLISETREQNLGTPGEGTPA